MYTAAKSPATPAMMAGTASSELRSSVEMSRSFSTSRTSLHAAAMQSADSGTQRLTRATMRIVVMGEKLQAWLEGDAKGQQVATGWRLRVEVGAPSQRAVAVRVDLRIRIRVVRRVRPQVAGREAERRVAHGGPLEESGRDLVEDADLAELEEVGALHQVAGAQDADEVQQRITGRCRGRPRAAGQRQVGVAGELGDRPPFREVLLEHPGREVALRGHRPALPETDVALQRPTVGRSGRASINESVRPDVRPLDGIPGLEPAGPDADDRIPLDDPHGSTARSEA